MRTIRAIVRDGSLQLLEPINLPENTHLTVALIEGDDIPAEALAEIARSSGCFDFLSDPREDIYSESDGEAV
jgi:hypothetical protein